MENIDNLQNQLNELEKKKGEVIEEKQEFEPGTIEWLNMELDSIESRIREIRAKLNGEDNKTEQKH